MKTLNDSKDIGSFALGDNYYVLNKAMLPPCNPYKLVTQFYLCQHFLSMAL
jgi:hypothetical protein